jgi:hypothetical protein
MSAGDAGENSFAYVEVELKLTPTFTLSLSPEVYNDRINAQYVRNVSDPSAAATYGRRYIFAEVKQTTVASTVRMNWILTPELSFQVFAQPFISSGVYSNYKELLRPKTFDFRTFGNDGSTITPIATPEGTVVGYTLDPDGNGPANAVGVGKPDFDYRSLRGNAVLRWEYMPGSVLFLVWTQSREDYEPVGDFQFGRSIDRIVNVKPDNIFMLKLSYWFGM